LRICCAAIYFIALLGPPKQQETTTVSSACAVAPDVGQSSFVTTIFVTIDPIMPDRLHVTAKFLGIAVGVFAWVWLLVVLGRGARSRSWLAIVGFVPSVGLLTASFVMGNDWMVLLALASLLIVTFSWSISP
jgi:hypothetical protein